VTAAVREAVPAEITARTETVNAETFVTEIVTAAATETATAGVTEIVTEMTATETATVDAIATVTGMIPGLNRDLVQDRLAAEITAAVMRKIPFGIRINNSTYFVKRGNVCITFLFLIVCPVIREVDEWECQ
jgi:hypothetical protein